MISFALKTFFVLFLLWHKRKTHVEIHTHTHTQNIKRICYKIYLDFCCNAMNPIGSDRITVSHASTANTTAGYSEPFVHLPTLLNSYQTCKDDEKIVMFHCNVVSKRSQFSKVKNKKGYVICLLFKGYSFYNYL